MKYLVLLYAEPGAWPPDEHKVALQKSIDLCHELHAQGQYHLASPLHPPATAKSVRVRNGKATISDGPYAETKEQLGGFFLIEARDMDEAVAIATRVPGATRGTAEVRQLMEVEAMPKA